MLKDYVSIGYLDFGNNQEYEVMAPKVMSFSTEPFIHLNFPLYIVSHEEPECPENLQYFLAELIQKQPQHLNLVVLLIGKMLTARYPTY